MGTGPFEDGGEQEAARLLRQLSDYTSTVVRQEIRRTQLQPEQAQRHAKPRDRRLTAAGLLALLGLATLVAAGVILLASVLGAGLAAVAVGATLLVLAAALILSGTRRPTQASASSGTPSV